MIIYIIISAVAALGLWLILSEVAYNRTSRLRRTLRQFDNTENKEGLSDKLIYPLAGWLQEYIKLSELKKERLERELRAAQLNISPELYVARNIVGTALVVVLCLVLGILVWRVLAVAGILVGFFVYRFLSSSATKAAKKIRAEIDEEMPSFASYVCAYVRESHDVLDLLERWRIRSGSAFAAELSICLADARTDGVEGALIRLDARSHSHMLSQIVRGLIAVDRGEYKIEHFERLEAEFDGVERERLRKLAKDGPSKVRPYSLLLFGAFMVVLLVVVITFFISNTQTLF